MYVYMYTINNYVGLYKGSSCVHSKQTTHMRNYAYISSTLIILIAVIAKVATADNTQVATTTVVDDTSTTADGSSVAVGTIATINVYDIAVASLILTCFLAVCVIVTLFYVNKFEVTHTIHTDSPLSEEILESGGAQSECEVLCCTEKDGDEHSSLAETMSIPDNDDECNQRSEGTFPGSGHDPHIVTASSERQSNQLDVCV